MSAVSRGISFENYVARQLENKGCLVAVLRHRKGGGDLLVLWPDGRKWMIECKATQRPFSNFPPRERRELREKASLFGAKAWLAYRIPGPSIAWYPEEGWPG